MDREKVIEAFADYEPYSHDLPCVTIKSKVYRDALALLKEQDERIKQLESMNVTASGNATAIGIVKGGLVIGKQTAKEIHNIKHVEVMNL